MYSDALAEKPLTEAVEEIQSQSQYTSLSQLPDMYLDAVVAVEDHRFWKHHGFDIIAIGRAVKNNVVAGSLQEGGSTITQQLAKNMYFSLDKTFTRKVAETFMAMKMEREYTKDEILEIYVNTIYFGDGYYGIRQASEGYYGKEPAQLSDDECIMLAGLPNAPSVYSPSVNLELAAERQQYVAEQMEKYGYTGDEEK
ncbi:MAG TPA: transglycosylase domain-containing protein [Candidatus Copromorpha excrementipullorum]|uniref:Penicillin-binding protein 1A n=1 Tax=Candidatus Allocopromorpha excrementipullorum TaxID=2840743 RepID=A0A9D1N6S3_9FIRM|nr:transglycosylase domain-containing protein [Candidatus Copromorpha excrementipullorum]